MQLLLAVLICLIHVCMVSWFKPYEVEWINDVALLASVTLTVTILTGQPSAQLGAVCKRVSVRRPMRLQGIDVNMRITA